MNSEINLRMWYSSRLDDNGCSIRVSTDTSTYWHRDAGFGQPSQQHSAQDVQQHFITHGQHRHVSIIAYAVSELIQKPRLYDRSLGI